MTIMTMLSNLIIGPLKLLFDVIFSVANRELSTGMSIIVLSIVVNVMVLPLYKRAEDLQERQRKIEETLSPGIKHIRKAFHGDEQVMILQKYYQQNHYSPFHALKGILPLLLQVPFFIAAYQFLIRQGSLQGASFGPIQDLGQEDGLLRIGNISINLLPILMTMINLLSGAVYLRKRAVKEKLQLGGMALIFLVLLYHSPAGLTLYWTMNNLFSLGKNIVEKLFPFESGKNPSAHVFSARRPRPGLFFIIAACLAILTGMMIPSTVLAASPQEFINYFSSPNPLWYAVNAFLLATGTFVFWAGIYYLLAGSTVKRGMEIGAWVLLGVFLVDYLFFRNGLGTMSSTLKYDVPPAYTTVQILINLGVLLLVSVVLFMVLKKEEMLVKGISWTLAIAMTGLSVYNLGIIRTESASAYENKYRNYQGAEEIPLSTEGQNVIVLMLDRAISSFIPCIMYERPDLKETFSGFVYYPNTLSFGANTNTGSPALFGGYEYTPWEMNIRDQELLQDKHNEALLLMPKLFSEAGYRVSVFDMPYPGNYSNAGDYSIYDDLPNTNARALVGAIRTNQKWDWPENQRFRNFFCHSLSMVAPSFLFGTVYNMGFYNATDGSASLFSMSGEELINYGQDLADEDFMKEYDVLTGIKGMTRILQNEENTFLLMNNGTTHDPVLLPEPEYAPLYAANNIEYDAAHADRFLAGPFPLVIDNYYDWFLQMRSYEVNMAAMLVIGDWLTYLKEMGVYDNTRIIMVADHGFELKLTDQGQLEADREVMEYNPLLMVKDFNATGEIKTDTVFMTNADTPTLAMEGLIENPVNPFTGKWVSSESKYGDLYVIHSKEWKVGKTAGAKFLPSSWYMVAPGGDTLFDTFRWTYLPEEK